jgi:hypothetical protein
MRLKMDLIGLLLRSGLTKKRASQKMAEAILKQYEEAVAQH